VVPQKKEKKKKQDYTSHDFIVAWNKSIMVIRVLTPTRTVSRYERFGEKCCLHLQERLYFNTLIKIFCTKQLLLEEMEAA
jgi:hypothetical protein